MRTIENIYKNICLYLSPKANMDIWDLTLEDLTLMGIANTP